MKHVKLLNANNYKLCQFITETIRLHFHLFYDQFSFSFWIFIDVLKAAGSINKFYGLLCKKNFLTSLTN